MKVKARSVRPKPTSPDSQSTTVASTGYTKRTARSRTEITLKPAAELTLDEIAGCYALAARAGLVAPPGSLERIHFAHNPTIVTAYRDGRLVGLQSHSVYLMRTPFRPAPISVIYGGIAVQDADAAALGIARHMIFSYLRHVLGPLWPLRRYAFLTGTSNPRLIEKLDVQLRLYLPSDRALPEPVIRFVRDFVREQRSTPGLVSSQLLRPNPPDIAQRDITAAWPLLYRASAAKYNALAQDLGLINSNGGRHYLGENYLYVIGRSSRLKLFKAGWVLGQKMIVRRRRAAASSTTSKEVDMTQWH